jgi:hypothetical protein
MQPNPGAFPYSFGYRFFAQDTLGARSTAARYHGLCSGKSVALLLQPSDQAHPGRDRQFHRFSTARWRSEWKQGSLAKPTMHGPLRRRHLRCRVTESRPTCPTTLGTLINVSTRAYVGSGAQQLIGGFIVKGTGGKSVLIRAVGPSLSAFGVAETLTDPVLRVFRSPDSIPLAENDNWGEQARPQDTMVQGFPLGKRQP